MQNKKKVSVEQILLYGVKKGGLYLKTIEGKYRNYTSFIKEAEMFLCKEDAEQLAKDIGGTIVKIQIKEME